MFRLELLLSYQSDPGTGFAGGDELMKTGADVGVDTAVAVHCTPLQRHVLPLDV